VQQGARGKFSPDTRGKRGGIQQIHVGVLKTKPMTAARKEKTRQGGGRSRTTVGSAFECARGWGISEPKPDKKGEQGDTGCGGTEIGGSG